MGIITGKKLKQLASENQMATKSQKASTAINYIIAKFGTVQDTAHYYHRGGGIWAKYIIANDRKRTGKLAKSRLQWQHTPYKWDLPGVDTKYKKLHVINPKPREDKSVETERNAIQNAMKTAMSTIAADTKARMSIDNVWHKGKPQQQIIKERLINLINYLNEARIEVHNKVPNREAAYFSALKYVRAVVSQPTIRTSDCEQIIRLIRELVHNLPSERKLKKVVTETKRFIIINPRVEVPESTKKVKEVKQPSALKPRSHTVTKTKKYEVTTTEKKYLRKALIAASADPKPFIKRRADTRQVFELGLRKKLLVKSIKQAAGYLVIARDQVPRSQTERRSKYNKVIELLKKKASDPKISVANCRNCANRVNALFKI